LDSALAVGEIEFISEFAELSIVRPVVPIVAPVVAVDPVPEAMLEAEVSAAVEDVTPVSDEIGDVAVVVDIVAAPVVDARPDSGSTAAEANGAEVSGVDSAELSGVLAADVSGETVCAAEPAEVPATWASAVACPAAAVPEVVGGGERNGVNCEKTDDDPA
jgi:hypothetical protein